jgi:4-amino-4-deoxy-L-arabinose transferase-like glycosyltransferase
VNADATVNAGTSVRMRDRRLTASKYAVVLLAVVAAAAAVRLPALREAPIFGDEAIFLRLARIVRAAPLEQLWVPLRTPNAPLHVWLLALALPMSQDPVLAGRLLSVLFGVLLVPALAGAVWAIGRAFGERSDESVRISAISASGLAAIAPFLVFSDRIARPDTLFALETVLAAGLSATIASRSRPILPAVAFGVLMGLTMLTRQAVSYPLWLLPPIALVAANRHDLRRFLVPLSVALAIALALWIPMLLVPGWPDVFTRIFHLGAARPSLPGWERAALFARNLGTAAAAFWTYLTPPLFVTGVAGSVILAAKRRRLLAFLVAWGALLLLPPAAFAVDYFPRYALPAVLPLLAAGGFGIGLEWSRAPRWARVALVTAIFSWPVIDVGRALSSRHAWRLLPVDRRQFVSGWSAGLASQRAAAFLEGLARSTPITVVLPRVSGNPSDAVWLQLDGARNIRLAYADDFLRLPARRVGGDVWTDQRAMTVEANRPVYFISQDPVFLGRDGWAPASTVVLPLNPGARLVARFENLLDENGRVESAVVIYRLD